MGCRRCATLPGVFADGTAAALGCLRAGGLQCRILTHYALFGLLTFGRVGLQHLEHATGEERLAVAHGLSQSFEAMLFIGEEEDVAFGACVAARVCVCEQAHVSYPPVLLQTWGAASFKCGCRATKSRCSCITSACTGRVTTTSRSITLVCAISRLKTMSARSPCSKSVWLWTVRGLCWPVLPGVNQAWGITMECGCVVGCCGQTHTSQPPSPWQKRRNTWACHPPRPRRRGLALGRVCTSVKP